MCVVSYVGGYFNDRWPNQYPWVEPIVNPPGVGTVTIGTGPTKEEFEALKKEVEALKELLKAAKIFDEATNQPHCEHEEKVALIKKIAELVGVDMTEVLK